MRPSGNVEVVCAGNGFNSPKIDKRLGGIAWHTNAEK